MTERTVRDRILDLLYPPKCAFCRRLVEDGRMLCPACKEELPRIGEEWCKKVIPPMEACYSPLCYTGMVRESLHRYKFHGAAAYAGIYGELMADCIREAGVEAELVTWVPLSRKRLRSRGYDQAFLLAKEVARRLELPLERTLEKIRNNPAQSGTAGADERQNNVKGVYRRLTSFTDEHILLVDDIVTTGATLREAAGVLIESGAERVTGLTLARTIREIT